MSASTIDQDAARLLAESIAEGELSPSPSIETLSRIAAIVTAAVTAPAPRKTKTAMGHHSQAVRREDEHALAHHAAT